VSTTFCEIEKSEELSQSPNKLPTSITWPLNEASNKEYELEESADDSKIELTKTITADRLSEAKVKYSGYLTRPKLSPRGFNSSQYLGSDDLALETPQTLISSIVNKVDKSYQVDLDDLKPNMIDHQTQMTPPISPLKHIKLDQIITQGDDEDEVSKVSIGTETEDNSLHPAEIVKTFAISTQTLNEEEETKVEAKDNKIPIMDLDESGSSDEGGIKLDAVSIPIVKENIRRALVRDGKSGVDTELNDEQCLILLQGMKKMDDDFKSELKNLTNEEVTKSELFHLIKNFSTLSKKERKRLEFLIVSNLNKTANKKKQESDDNEGGLDTSQAIKIQNASLDSYLQSLLDEKDNVTSKLKGELFKVL